MRVSLQLTEDVTAELAWAAPGVTSVQNDISVA